LTKRLKKKETALYKCYKIPLICDILKNIPDKGAIHIMAATEPIRDKKQLKSLANYFLTRINRNQKFLPERLHPTHTSSHGCSIYLQIIPSKQPQRQGSRRLSSNRGKSWQRVIVKPVKIFTIDKKSLDLD